MAYSELFKNYSDIRNFMRRFYVYGFEKRQDFYRQKLQKLR